MMRFHKKHRPDSNAAIHQPLKGIGKAGKDVAFEKRLAKRLGLQRKSFGVAQGKGTSPTLTGWYNGRLGRHGTAITIEYGARPSKRYRLSTAAHGILWASRVHR